MAHGERDAAALAVDVCLGELHDLADAQPGADGKVEDVDEGIAPGVAPVRGDVGGDAGCVV